MIEKESFNTFVQSELNKNNVSKEVLQINYSIFLYEKYLRLLGVNVNDVVDYILDPVYIDLTEYELSLFKKALENVARNSFLDNVITDDVFKAAFATFLRAKKDSKLKFREYEQLCKDVNYLYSNGQPNDIKRNNILWSTTCKELQILLNLDGFPYTDRYLLTNKVESNLPYTLQYSKLVSELHRLTFTLNFSSEENLAYISHFIVRIMMQTDTIKKDKDLMFHLDDWQFYTRPFVYEEKMAALTKEFSKENQNLLNTYLGEGDVEKVKEIKKCLKQWFLKKDPEANFK